MTPAGPVAEPARARGAAGAPTGVAAQREDPELGIRERAEFFGPDRMFGYLHAPIGRPVGGVVVLSPIESEMEVNYRREVLLARALSSRGAAVARFHYRGSGHSRGRGADVGLEELRDDALAAAGWLADRTGVSGVAFVGTRLGALVAASAVGEFPGAPLALWEPVVSGRRYFREVFRTSRILGLKGDEPAARAPGASAAQEMREAGFVNVVGYRIHRRLVETTGGRTLVGEFAEGRRPVLLVQLSHGERLRREYRSTVETLGDLGCAVEATVIPEPTIWWMGFRGWEPEEERVGTRSLVEVTAGWLLRQLQRGDG